MAVMRYSKRSNANRCEPARGPKSTQTTEICPKYFSLNEQRFDARS